MRFQKIRGGIGAAAILILTMVLASCGGDSNGEEKDANTNKSSTPLTVKATQIIQTDLEDLALADERRLADVLLQLQYLAKEIDHKELQARQQNLRTVANEAITSVSNALQSVSLPEVLNLYKQGKATEEDLSLAVSKAESQILFLDSAGIDMLTKTAVLDTLSKLIDIDPANLTLQYDDQIGRYTRFTNETLGRYEEAIWVFSSPFDWLNAALPINRNVNQDSQP